VSFFDEPEETRTPPRTAPRRRRPTGGGRRPRGPNSQAILIRRLVLAAVVVVAIVLIAVAVNSCEVSARNSALKDYNNSVASLNAQSVNTGKTFFSLLAGPKNDPTSLQNNLNQTLAEANGELSKAKGLGVPDEVKDAQGNFVLALQMRSDGIRNIGAQVQPALQSQTSQEAVNTITSEMARFYSSDVLYKDYTVPLIIGALRAAGISIGGLSGQQVNTSQFLPSIQWLDPSVVARELHVTLPASGGGPSTAKAAPGPHGHAMQSVSVGGTALQTGATNTVPASPPPTFTCVFTNDGGNTETNVVVKVTVQGTSITGQTTVPKTVPGGTYTADVKLSSSPPRGTDQVSATVEPVPGEKTFVHNTQTFSVTFQ
jgi:hypothetical protein